MASLVLVANVMKMIGLVVVVDVAKTTGLVAVVKMAGCWMRSIWSKWRVWWWSM